MYFNIYICNLLEYATSRSFGEKNFIDLLVNPKISFTFIKPKTKGYFP